MEQPYGFQLLIVTSALVAVIVPRLVLGCSILMLTTSLRHSAGTNARPVIAGCERYLPNL